MTPLSVPIIAGLRELADRYDVLLCDVWGVVHDGRRVFPAIVDAFAAYRDRGGTVILLTNAPRPRGPVVRQLETLGLPSDAYDAVVTSGDATVALIAARGEAPTFHIGPARDLALLREVAATTGFEPPLAAPEEASYVLCTGLRDDSREEPEDYADLLAALRRRDLEMICANPDIVVHIGETLTYCAGALAERYAALGGTVRYAGKPHAPIYDVALGVAAERRGGGVDPRQVLAIGDGVKTDIAGARGRGLDSLFVASGIHRAESLAAASDTVDPAGLGRLMVEAGEAPVAAIPHVVW